MSSRAQDSFLGHPKGLGVLAFTEAWERFSFYGMQTLLVLYMVNRLLLPGHIESVIGFGAVKRLLFSVTGELSPQATASELFGLYAGAVFLTPILGGLLADRVLGRRRTVMLGGMLMAIGHFLMAFDALFLIALSALIIGCGCFKGNISGQVGALYEVGDQRAADGFQIFFLGINAGGLAAPLVCGTLGETLGWHFGFAAAGVGMIVGLITYWAGRKYLPSEDRRARVATRAPLLLTRGERLRVLVLILLIPILALASVGNQQVYDAYLVWAQRSADLTAFGHTVPTTWLITLDTLASTTCLAASATFWKAWSRRFKEPDELQKIALGWIFSALSLLSLAAGAAISQRRKVPFFWLALFHVLDSIGYANVYPVSLAVYSRAGPPALKSTIIGIYYLQFVIGNNLVGWIGTRLDLMPASNFWLLHVAVVAASAVLLLIVRPAIAACLLRPGVGR